MIRSMVCIVLGLAVAGCSDSGPERVPVSGEIVMSDGKPVFPGSILFVPQEGGEYQASTLLQEGGRFTLRTYPHGDGVVPGKYKVVLSLGMGSPAELAKYASVKTSTLEVLVPPEGVTDLKLKLDVSAGPGRRGGPPGLRR